jgi:hypothetical protein
VIKLGAELKRRLVDSLTDQRAVVVAYADSRGYPHVSFYGSVHAHSDDELALWVRSPKGELLKAIPANPRLGLAYADITTRTYYRMYGRARIADDPTTRARVFESMAKLEQSLDPERKGTAVVIELDSVSGHDAASGLFSMARD